MDNRAKMCEYLNGDETVKMWRVITVGCKSVISMSLSIKRNKFVMKGDKINVNVCLYVL